MKKNKVQTVLFYVSQNREKFFLLLRMNELRGLLWQNITGSVEEGESFEEAAIREACEETGIQHNNIKTVGQLPLLFKFTDQWQNQVAEKVFFLEAKKKWNVRIDSSEHCEFSWVSEKNVHQNSVHYATNFQAIQAVISR